MFFFFIPDTDSQCCKHKHEPAKIYIVTREKRKIIYANETSQIIFLEYFQITLTLSYDIDTCTVQLGYCDSVVTVCLLLWNMPIIQDRDVKFPYKRYTYYLQAY